MLDRGLHRRLFLGTGVALAGLAWAMLWLGPAMPVGWAGAICGPAAAGPLAAALGWLVMLSAMMLPTTLPLLTIYARLVVRRSDRALLLGLVLVGYLAAWAGFGMLAQGAGLGLADLVGRSGWLTFNGWAIAAALLALAGGFQFSGLKRRCLDRCRMPMGFVLEHWRGRGPRRQAVRLGWRHGLYCVGCCWALMLLMGLVGSGGLGWMLLLGLVMAVEKNMAWGWRISAPLGVALLGASAGLVLANL